MTRLGRALPPLVFGLGVLVVWELLLLITDPDGFVLPRPTEIAAALVDNWSAIWDATLITGFVVLTGLLAGVLMGAGAALLVTRFRLANETLTPLAIAVSAIPIVATAPVFNAWYGILGPESNQAVVLLLTFFPVFVNTAKGLTQVEPSQIELMRSYAAGEWTITKEVRIPNALPFFFTALKLVVSLAVIAAIVAEYFGGRQDTLGQIIVQRAGLTQYDDAWAAVVAGSALGLTLFGIVTVAERRLLPWHNSAASAE